MNQRERLGVSKVENGHRIHIPVNVQKILKLDNGKNFYVSWEQDDQGNILLFRGQLHFNRTGNCPKADPCEDCEEKGNNTTKVVRREHGSADNP